MFKKGRQLSSADNAANAAADRFQAIREICPGQQIPARHEAHKLKGSGLQRFLKGRLHTMITGPTVGPNLTTGGLSIYIL